MEYYFERYRCQMALPGFGKEGQEKLKQASVLIIGMGGLGCPVAQYLTASGVGTIGLADHDVVAVRNLHRQILFSPKDVGKLKVTVACEKLSSQNPDVKLIPYSFRVNSDNVMDLVKNYDLIIEGTDNFETKYLLNDACVLSRKPLIYGAIYRYEGQVAIWNVLRSDGTYSPNYRDVFPDAEKADIPNCVDGGVMPGLCGMVGSMQANEAVKYLTGSDKILAGKLWLMNMSDGRTTVIKLKNSRAGHIHHLNDSILLIDFEQLKERVTQNDMEIIDVRSADEHQKFNIGGENIPLSELGNCLPDLQFSKPVTCYCTSGKRSLSAARLLSGTFPGISFFSLKGGLEKTFS